MTTSMQTESRLLPDNPSATKALEALNQAALSIAGELDLNRVLQSIVESAKELIGSRYAALAVGDWRETSHTGTQRFLHTGMTQEDIRAIPHWPRGEGLLGAVIHEQRSIRLEDMAADPRSCGLPAGHPPMHSFLGVPITGGGETLGNLYLADKLDGTPFTATDQYLVEMLATHAAVAIQNATLYSQVERLAILEERQRIGMDLHDGVIQSIYAVGLTLESVRLTLGPEAEESSALLDQAIGGLNEAIRDIRNFILDLRPRRFPGDVNKGMAQLVREFQANTMVPVMLDVPEKLDELPLPIARALYLSTQEALANVARHARAQQVTVSLHCTNQRVLLTVADDGRGFDAGNEAIRIGHGLANMQSRAESLGGVFRLKSNPGGGTAVTLDIPR